MAYDKQPSTPDKAKQSHPNQTESHRILCNTGRALPQPFCGEATLSPLAPHGTVPRSGVPCCTGQYSRVRWGALGYRKGVSGGSTRAVDVDVAARLPFTFACRTTFHANTCNRRCKHRRTIHVTLSATAVQRRRTATHCALSGADDAFPCAAHQPYSALSLRALLSLH